ncbi:MAG: DUF6966 domain-containing protein [Bacteroidia bacterium]
MTDHYKTALSILHQLLKESDNDHWANWILEDIHLWTSQKSVDQHLRAYGGMGSLNDLCVGGWDTLGVWKNNLFNTAKLLSCSLAEKKIATPPLDVEFYRSGLPDINGWRCQNCGHARIDSSRVEQYISALFLPQLVVDYIRQDKLIEILDLENIINTEQISSKRSALETLIQNANIALTTDPNSSSTCPACASKNVRFSRWQPTENETKLIES